MQKLVNGVHNFQREIFGSKRAFFEKLAREQRPLALFITCSDSRINPNLITQTDAGDLFILRNAGNIVPPFSTEHCGGDIATIEFAVAALNVRDIIVCGHSHCGAMKGLLNEAAIDNMPSVKQWLMHAEPTRRIIRDKFQHLVGDALLTATVEENVLVQIENLRSHPSVAAAIARQEMNLYAWVYKIETGEVFAFNPDEGQYLRLSERPAMPAYPALRLSEQRVI